MAVFHPRSALARTGQIQQFALCRGILRTTIGRYSTKPTHAPKVTIDIKHIREHPDLYKKNCIQRNYKALSSNPYRILELFTSWREAESHAKPLRIRSHTLQAALKRERPLEQQAKNENTLTTLLAEARKVKEQLSDIESIGTSLFEEIQELGAALPNLTSPETPIGDTPKVLRYINEQAPILSNCGDKNPKSHIELGHALDLFDFKSASNVSGWGWYYLKNEAALMEQALVQYSLSVAMKNGFKVVSPPSMVYSHILSACGFQPRDQGGEQQIYQIQQDAQDASKRKPELCLAGTAEIPFAGMMADTDIPDTTLPLRIVGSSRCYRAEAGSRGTDTKGLYRVHEFTKVEMFAWTSPDKEHKAATRIFESMVEIQTEILKSLGLACRIVEQPSKDLGASATRKQDIEAFFPSRREHNGGWGEVTSASICSDYQTRRLATRIRFSSSTKSAFPYTVNGTAIAVPRVLAAILETNWNESDGSVNVPEVLLPFMHGIDRIGSK